MQKKGLGFLLLAGLLIISALVFLPSVRDSVQAQTGFSVSGKIYGWLWSDNIGWIRMGTSDTNAIQITNNSLTGYGWSDSVGWVNFAPASDYPEAPNHGVQIDPDPIGGTGTDYAVTGWARACSVFAGGCSGALKDEASRGGWDGWVKMINAKYNRVSKVFASSGFAWGDLNLGWVNFHAGDPDIDCNVPTPPPGCPANCTPGLNCNCSDPNPPPGCPTTCVGDDCGDGGTGSSLGCRVTPPNPTTGQTVTYTVAPLREGVSYTYAWSGNTGNLIAPSSLDNIPLLTQYSDTGTQNVEVAVTENGGPSTTYPCGDVIVGGGCISPEVECPDGSCSLDCSASCGIDDISIGRIALTFEYGGTSDIVEDSDAVEALTLTPTTGCTADNPLNINFNPLSGTLPNDPDVNIVCSTNLTAPEWVPCAGLGITGPILIGISAPANLDRTGLVNLNSALVNIVSSSGAGNSFPRWIRFYRPSEI